MGQVSPSHLYKLISQFNSSVLYVVGFSRDQSNEISQLQLPEKLLPSEVQVGACVL